MSIFDEPREQQLYELGLTEEDMTADVDTQSDEVLAIRFLLEFRTRPCYGLGENPYGIVIGDYYHDRPKDCTDEEEKRLIKESVRQKKNLFAEAWPEKTYIIPGADY